MFAGDGHLVPRWGRVLETNDITSTVIVGTHRSDDETLRLHEYSPGFAPDRFAEHEKFFVDDVRRWITSRLGVAPPAERTAVLGVSAGAELALAVGLRHPDVYGSNLCASPGAGHRPPPVMGGLLSRTYLVAGTSEPFFGANATRAVTLPELFRSPSVAIPPSVSATTESAVGMMVGMRDLYPAIEPFDHGMLDVGDGQQIYHESSGRADGKPVVFVHGGPGGGTSPDQRRFFDPEVYRIILFDQRGCGRSRPHIADGAVLTTNTTDHLIADMELLRSTLGVDRWQVFGGSWGSTLGLAYAQTHPERVTELVLRGIFLLRRSEIDWYYNGGAANIFPDLWEKYLAPIPHDERAGDLVAAYRRLLESPDAAVAQAAATAWTEWEQSTSHLLPRPGSDDETDARFDLAFATIENHYFTHRGFLDEGQLLRNAHRIADIPGVIVQGRYDVVCPMRSAWDLHRAWPGARLCIVNDAGHASFEAGITHHLVEATDRFGAAETTGSSAQR